MHKKIPMGPVERSVTIDILRLRDHELSLRLFHADLLSWSQDHLRVFPWRSTDNPFHILIAEMMLRRTQAKQVVPIYNQFILQYPDPQKLMNAPTVLLRIQSDRPYHRYQHCACSRAAFWYSNPCRVSPPPTCTSPLEKFT